MDQRRDEDIQRPQAACVEFLRQRLDADADERRQGAGGKALGHFLGDRTGVAVLFLVNAVAVAVLEIDPKVLHRLATKLVGDTRANGGRVHVSRQVERARERFAVTRVLVQGRQRHCTELAGGIRTEQVRSAIHGVNRLTVVPLSGKGLRDPVVDALQLLENGAEVPGLQRPCVRIWHLSTIRGMSCTRTG